MVPQFEIVRCEAADGVQLTGLYAASPGGNAAAIWVHGLGGNGYRSAMVPALAARLRRQRIGLLSLNTRGADLVTTRIRGRRRTPHNGAFYEIFSECVHDLRGAIAHLRRRGVRRIFLIGHSTGANKIAYAVQCGVRVTKVVYLAPGDDVAIQRTLLGPHRYARMQALAARLRLSDPHRLMPVKNLGYLPISAASYHSLFGVRSPMDQFPLASLRSTLRPERRWRRLARQTVPGLLVLGECDEYLPVPASVVVQFFRGNIPAIDGVLIPGANHSFTDVEMRMADTAAAFLAGKAVRRSRK